MVATNDRWFPVDTIYRSTDGGATWADVGASAKLDISASPYLAWGGTPKFGWWIGSVAIDPFNGNRAMYGTGATVFGTSDLTAADSGQPTTWSSAAATGIEETAVNDLLVPAAGSVQADQRGRRPGRLLPHLAVHVAIGRDDLAHPVHRHVASRRPATAPLDVAMVGWSGGDFSTDGGATWTAMTLPAGDPDGAGTVALSADGSALVWTPEDNSWAPQAAAPVYSTDQGKTWTASAGLAAGVAVVADPVNPKVFYAFDQSAGTLYVSADGGATFTAETAGLVTGTPSEGTNSLSLLHTVPGRTGDLWLTGGDGSLYHSTDGGKTFAKDASVGTVATVGFGKAAPCASQRCASQRCAATATRRST